MVRKFGGRSTGPTLLHLDIHGQGRAEYSKYILR